MIGLLAGSVSLYWRWLVLLVLIGAVFGAGATWEGKRAEKRMDAYRAAVDAAADRQAIHAGVVTLEGRKTLETTREGLKNEIASVAARYDAYRLNHPVRVQQSSGATNPGGVPRVPASPARIAEPDAESRFVAALRTCEENSVKLQRWQKWYSENSKSFSLSQ